MAMRRIQVLLEPEQHDELERRARLTGRSKSDLVREAVAVRYYPLPETDPAAEGTNSLADFFATMDAEAAAAAAREAELAADLDDGVEFDPNRFGGVIGSCASGRTDIAVHHDTYLYGGELWD